MKKILALLLVVVLIAMMAVGCAKPVAPAGEAAGAKKIKIGLSLPTQQEERWVRDKEAMEAEAKALGVELLVQITNMDAQKQQAQCEQLLSQGIDVLILAPHDALAAAATVELAKKQGVPVIAYDRLIMGAKDLDLYISFDNVAVGRLQGEYITKLVPKGDYVVLAGSPTDNNAKLFKQGAMEFIKPLVDKGDIKIVFEQDVIDWKPENAQKHMENALTATNNKIDAVLAPNDGTAGGCIQALAAQKLDGKIPITGQDAEVAAIKRIIAGQQNMTIYKDTRELGKAAIAAAISLAKKEAVKGATQKVNNDVKDVPSLLLTPYVIDKNNYKKMLVDSGYIKEADLK